MYITLFGYMGSGKTTIGRIISLYLGIKFYDLDVVIINWKNQYIHNFFFKNGENNFRKIEIYVFYFFKSIKKKNIISTGGGTPCFRKNFFLKREFLIFYLHISSKEIFQRIFYQKNKRPIISYFFYNKLLYFIHRHLSNRIKYYEKLNFKIEIVSRLTEEILFSIQNQLSIISYSNELIKSFK